MLKLVPLCIRKYNLHKREKQAYLKGAFSEPQNTNDMFTRCRSIFFFFTAIIANKPGFMEEPTVIQENLPMF